MSDIVEEYEKMLLSIENQSKLTVIDNGVVDFSNDINDTAESENVDSVELDDIDLEDMESSIDDILGNL